MGAAIAVSALAVLATLVFNVLDRDTVAWVAGEKITKKEVDEAIKKSGSDNKKQITSLLIEKKIVEIEAKKRGITVSDEEIKAMGPDNYYVSHGASMNSLKMNNTESKRFSIIRYKLAKEVIRRIEGEVIVVGISGYLSEEYLGSPDKAREKLNEDKKYAEETLKESQKKLNEGANVNTVAAELEKNQRLQGVRYINDYSNVEESFAQSLLGTESFLEQVIDKKEGQWEGPLMMSEKTESLSDPRIEEIVKQKTAPQGLVLIKIKLKQNADIKSFSEWIDAYKSKTVKYNRRFNEYF